MDIMKKIGASGLEAPLWREQDSNLRPLGYEPSELPLLYPAMFNECKGREFFDTVQVF